MAPCVLRTGQCDTRYGYSSPALTVQRNPWFQAAADGSTVDASFQIRAPVRATRFRRRVAAIRASATRRESRSQILRRFTMGRYGPFGVLPR